MLVCTNYAKYYWVRGGLNIGLKHFIPRRTSACFLNKQYTERKPCRYRDVTSQKYSLLLFYRIFQSTRLNIFAIINVACSNYNC